MMSNDLDMRDCLLSTRRILLFIFAVEAVNDDCDDALGKFFW